MDGWMDGYIIIIIIIIIIGFSTFKIFLKQPYGLLLFTVALIP